MEDRRFMWLLFLGFSMVILMWRCSQMDVKKNCIDLCATKNKSYHSYKRDNMFIIECYCR